MISIIYLLVSLLTPWLAGFFLLRAMESRAGYRPHPVRQVAFAFFLGYSLLQMLALSANAVFGDVPVIGIHIALGLITVCAYLLKRRAPATPATAATVGAEERQTSMQNRRQTGWVFWFFLCLAALHLSLAAVEILHRPIFPWDAWLSWLYRAKAWFFAGSILPMDAPQDWLQGSGEAIYNVAGAHYPSLVPITALWTALHLGYWSETLVNVPVIACGMALGGGIYGLCREAARSRQTSMIAAYLVLSIPLIGTHLSLAGQADIWMAGYAGLGIGACLLGLVKKVNGLFLLGLLLTSLSIGVKAEGGVWLAVALSVGAVSWLATRRKWRWILALPAIIVLLWLMGMQFVELPLLGGVGVSNGVLHVSFLGSHPLEWHAVLDDYWQNFFVGGSWHLLWPLLILAAVAAWRADNAPVRIIVLAFLCIVVASQAIIFGATSQGRWAENWTAINRIPLHLAPALVFCLVLVVPSGARSAAERSKIPIVKAGVAAFLLTCTLALTYLGVRFGNESGKPIDVGAADHRLVMGGGELKYGKRHITRFVNNAAVVSSGPIQINADSISLVSIDTAGTNHKGQNFFWRRANDPENLKMSQYEGRGTSYLRLRDNPEWAGTITEIGLVFYDDGGSLLVGDIAVQPDSLSARVRQSMTEWMQLIPWSQKSTHWSPAGASTGVLPLPLFTVGWLFLTLALIAVAAGGDKANGYRNSALMACLFAWLVLDLRWLINQGINTRATVSEYAPGNSQPLRFDGDGIIKRVVSEAASRIADDNNTLLITADDPRMRYQMLRAKYHALPYPSYVHERAREQLPTINRTALLLVLKQPYRDPAATPTTAAEWQAFLAAAGDDYRILWESASGFLLERTAETPRSVPPGPEK